MRNLFYKRINKNSRKLNAIKMRAAASSKYIFKITSNCAKVITYKILKKKNEASRNEEEIAIEYVRLH